MLDEQHCHSPAQNQPAGSESQQESSMCYAPIAAQFSFLEGKTLTVIDASFSDHVQRKAVKDLIRGHFRDQLRHVSSIMFTKGGGVCVEAGPNPYNDAP